NEHFRLWQERRSRPSSGWSMQPDAVQTRKKPFECRVILLGALSMTVNLSFRISGEVWYGIN
ncbi:MAG: hypothetical protein ACYSSN_10775, partial [Planctomycetota bacterium]